MLKLFAELLSQALDRWLDDRASVKKHNCFSAEAIGMAWKTVWEVSPT